MWKKKNQKCQQNICITPREIIQKFKQEIEVKKRFLSSLETLWSDGSKERKYWAILEEMMTHVLPK